MSEYDDLRAEVAALRTQVAALTAPRAAAPDDDGAVSRRGLLGRLAGAAVAGAGLAVLGAEPAAATAGNPVILGASSSTNDSGSVGTSLTCNSTQRTLDITQSGTGDAFRADVLSTSSTASAVGAVTNGLGSALDATVLNSSSSASAIYAYGRPEASGTGVEAHGATGVAGYDDNGGGIGVLGNTTDGMGVYGYAHAGRAVYGYANNGEGVALYGYSNGSYGLWVHGTRAQLFLDPMSGAGAPTSGTHLKGEVVVDVNGTHWICIASGTPGKWVRPGFNPTGPARLVSGAAAAGAFTPAQTKDFVVTGFGGIPASASAVAFNLSATSTANGYVTLFPAGAARPTASQLTFGPAYQWSGFAVVRTGTGGKVSCYNSAGSTKLSIDVAGYFA
jgi:hypothetical protein